MVGLDQIAQISDYYVLWILIRNHDILIHLFLFINLKQEKLDEHSIFDLFKFLYQLYLSLLWVQLAIFEKLTVEYYLNMALLLGIQSYSQKHDCLIILFWRRWALIFIFEIEYNLFVKVEYLQIMTHLIEMA